MPGRAAPPPGLPCTGLGGGATGVRREGAEGTDRWRRLPRDLIALGRAVGRAGVGGRGDGCRLAGGRAVTQAQTDPRRGRPLWKTASPSRRGTLGCTPPPPSLPMSAVEAPLSPGGGGGEEWRASAWRRWREGGRQEAPGGSASARSAFNSISPRPRPARAPRKEASGTLIRSAVIPSPESHSPFRFPSQILCAACHPVLRDFAKGLNDNMQTFL